MSELQGKSTESEYLFRPSRTLSTFWNEDILATAIEIKRIYDQGFMKPDEDIITNAWNWLKSDSGHACLVNEELLLSENASDMIPVSVAFNWNVVQFMARKHDYRTETGIFRFEPFVAFAPGSESFTDDIKYTTNDLYQRLLRIKERHNVPDPFSRMRFADHREISRDVLAVIESSEKSDVLTYLLLQQYHLVLMRREKAVLARTFPIRYQ